MYKSMLPSEEKNPVLHVPQPTAPGSAMVPALQNPLHQQAQQQMNGHDANTVGPVAVQPAAAIPALAPTMHSAAGAVDEAAWVEHLKSVMQQTQNEPYRQVQMIQQMQALYQKEHFGKTVGDGEGS